MKAMLLMNCNASEYSIASQIAAPIEPIAISANRNITIQPSRCIQWDLRSTEKACLDLLKILSFGNMFRQYQVGTVNGVGGAGYLFSDGLSHRSRVYT